MIRPVRLQLSRRRGFNLQRHSLSQNGLHAINCARPTKWSNPFSIQHCMKIFEGTDEASARVKAVHLHKDWLAGLLDEATLFPRPTIEEIREALKGHNLACWCRLDQRCHTDVLMKIANPELEIDHA